MRWSLMLLALVAILHCSYAPPVTPDKKEQDSEIKDDLEEYMEYHRYLKEVVQALESDPDFRERLEKADEEDVRSGKIAEQLDFVNHNVRTKLDEIKRREMERLRHLATKQYELSNNIDSDVKKVPTKEHLDHQNPHTFEMEDLKRLIKKTIVDLETADKQRKEEFKEYEMQKEFEKHQKLEGMDETQKNDYMEQLKKEEEAKKHHQPLHHPGSKPQLEEVWEKQDHMDQQFDPKAFFMMHDVDGNGVWDADEVKALFIKELDKMYSPDGPNKDLHERAEEMERMREHVFQENDKNRDGLIDFHEFLMETQKADFNRDEGWKSIDENQVYTQAEYQEFERRRMDEMRYLQQRGLVDAHGRPIPGAQHQINQALHEYQQQQAYHYQQQQGIHQQQYQQQQVPQYQGQPQNQGQPQYHPQGQAPQGVPQGIPQGQGQYQVPQQGYQQGQVPQYQGQYPQGQQQVQNPQGQQQIQNPQGQQPVPNQFQGQAAKPVNQVQVQQPPMHPGQVQQPQGQQPAQGQGQMPQAQQPPVQGQQPLVQGQQPPVQGQQPPVQQSQVQQPQGQGQSQPPPSQAPNQPLVQNQNQIPPSNVGGH